MKKINDITTKIEKIDDKITLLLVILLLIPLIVLKKQFFIISPKIMNNMYGSRLNFEYFNYYKLMALVTLSLLIFLLFMYKVVFFKYEIKINSINKSLIIFLFAIMISLNLSEFKNIVIMGNGDRFEGVLAWLCYIIIFFVAYNIKITNENMRYFVFILLPVIIVNLVLGILNFYEINILNYDITQTMIGASGEVNGQFWTTLYNPNFISGLCGALFISSITYLILEKNIKIKIVMLLISLMLFTTVLTSLSLSGFMTIIVLVPIVIIGAWIFIDKKEIIKWMAILLVCCSMIFAFLNSHNSGVWDNSLGFFIKLETVQTNENESMDSLSSGRIHIWKKTIELIKKKPLFGYGFDTLPYYIDHDDPLSNNIIIDKPHNWFLTITYGTGIVGLIGVLGILWCLIKGMFKCWKDKINDKVVYITGAFVGGFIVQGMVNDSFIGTSVVFWVLAGICANRLNLYSENK